MKVLIAMSLLLRLTSAMMSFPIHLGGFGGDTAIEMFDFDQSFNLVVTGISYDT
jgi:hypothetical protein